MQVRLDRPLGRTTLAEQAIQLRPHRHARLSPTTDRIRQGTRPRMGGRRNRVRPSSRVLRPVLTRLEQDSKRQDRRTLDQALRQYGHVRPWARR
jgi:hypothetical protein